MPPGEHAHLVVSSDGRVIELDDTAERLLGPARGRSLTDLVDTPDPIVAELLADLRRSTGPVPGRLVFRTAHGTHALALTGSRLSPYTDEVAISVRLGEDRFAELTEALDRTNVEIARRMAVEEQLRLVWSQTVTQLEGSRDDLRRLGQAMAHDLRSPLTAIRGFVGLAREDPGMGEDSRAMLDRVLRAADGMEEIIEGLLSEAVQRVHATRADLPLVEVVEWVGSLVDDEVVHLEAVGPLPVVHVSVQAVRQLLLNLVSNAGKHRGRLGPVSVTVEATVADGRCEVLVADDGPGVPLELRDAVFERGVSTEQEGIHGLGLAMCRRIVEEHGGRIALEESASGGALVRFSLPLSAEPVAG